MEVQFEVVSCLEKKHYVQWYQHILRRRILWVILFSFVGFVSLLLGIKNADYGDLIYAGVCAVYVIWNYRRPWILAKKHLKRDVEYYGTQGHARSFVCYHLRGDDSGCDKGHGYDHALR